MPLLTLSAGPLSLGLLPEAGGSVTHWRHSTRALLRESPEGALATLNSRAMASFPLVPFSNRIRGGRFSWGGEDFALSRQSGDPRHALHGGARFLPWRVAAQNAQSVRLELDYQPDAEDAWPFAYKAWQQFVLRQDRLHLSLGLQNLSSVAAPAGLGWHPYFTREKQTTLAFTAAHLWEKDGEDIPIRASKPTHAFDFSVAKGLGEGLIDHAYGGWSGEASIAYPESGLRLHLHVSRSLGDIILFTPMEQDFFALEPVSHRPDGINPNGEAADQGITELAPGATLEGWIEIAVAPLTR
ncbi:MAG: hypothetical protein B7X08_03790 [Acidocella sp. 20-63-7]|nr:MAG: hypothetical protein B7X08_03790 [Acidocella sp. 20-63-7]HQT46104.1 aldose 1-epimerase [Acidocella sp.]